MKRVVIHVPINVIGHTVSYVREQLLSLEERGEEATHTYIPQDEEYASEFVEEWLKEAIAKQNQPEAALNMATEYAHLTNEQLSGQFDAVNGVCESVCPISDALQPLVDPAGRWYPVALVPLSIFYNRTKVDESQLKHSWEDLMDAGYRVRFPDQDKPISRAMCAFLKANWPEKYEDFMQRATFGGLPPNVMRSVASGEYDMCMSLDSFSTVQISDVLVKEETKEGNILLPMVVSAAKGTAEQMKRVLELLAGKELQEYMEAQGIWSVHAQTAAPKAYENNKQLSTWSGWDTYLDQIRSVM